MRIAHIVAVIIFTIFALWQIDDPDPIRWVLAYGFAALMSLLAALNVNVKIPASIGIVVFCIWAVTIIPPHFTTWLSEETGREALGLLLAALWMGIAIARQRGPVIPRT